MKYCQINEQDIIDSYFADNSPVNNVVVDIGAGDGYVLSNTRHLINAGWNGILIDGDPRGNNEVHKALINTTNVNELLHNLNCPTNPAFLSLDLDGNDYWIIKTILEQFTPQLICVEYNPSHSPEPVTIKYNESHRWDNTDYYGATPEAWMKLMATNQYSLCGQNSLNLFFSKDGVDMPLMTKRSQHHPMDKLNRPWVQV